MTQIGFPYRLDVSGRTAGAGLERHVRDLIEQILLTAPGERINRPDFGSGLLQMVFDPIQPEVITATQYMVQASLQQWLGDRIQLGGVAVEGTDSTVTITVKYMLQQDQIQRVETFSREL